MSESGENEVGSGREAHMKKTLERKAAERAVIAGYESWLRRYARLRRLPRECWGLWAVEGGIIGAFERGIEDKDLALGIAIVRANVGIGGFGFAVFADGAYSREEAREVMESMRGREIKNTARRLTRLFRCGRFRLRAMRHRDEYVEKLQKLARCWDQMPITNPLPA